MNRIAFDAIGTSWQIMSPTPIGAGLQQQIDTIIRSFDSQYSRFDDNSAVMNLAHNGGTATFTDGVPELFRLYDELYTLTDGAVSPLIGNTLSALGYDKNYSLRQSARRDVPIYPEVLTHISQTISLSVPAILDIGAVGKGYLIDRIAHLMDKAHGAYTVDGSGDLFVKGRPQTIGLEDPRDPTRAIGTITLTDGALCASASNKRAWGDGLHHVIDGRTGIPTKDVIATWVAADSAMIADGLATALFFVPPEKLAGHYSFLYIVMFSDGSVRYTHHPRITIFD